MPLPANDSQTDNGNGKVTLALVCQEVRHLGERQVEQHALTQSMIREVTDRLDRQHADHENRLRTVEKRSTERQQEVADIKTDVKDLTEEMKVVQGRTKRDGNVSLAALATALGSIVAFLSGLTK